MNYSLVNWAARRADVADVYEKAVLMVLADAADAVTAQTFIGQATIAERCKMSTRAVVNVMRRLEAAGLISRARRNGSGGHRTSDLITLCQGARDAHREPHQSESHASRGPVLTAPDDISKVHPVQGISKVISQNISISSELHPEPAKVKAGYPEEFEKLWMTYPHVKGRSSKNIAHNQWAKLTNVDRGNFVLAVCKFVGSAQATRDGGQFVPAMERWISKGQWRDFVPTDAPKPEGIYLPPTDEWAEAMKLWGIGKWNSTAWGPRPNEPGCRVPVEVLARHGFVTGVTPFPASKGGVA